MPIYEYLCQACKKEFEVSLSVPELERRKQIKCPACGSSKVARQISRFQVQTPKKS